LNAFFFAGLPAGFLPPSGVADASIGSFLAIVSFQLPASSFQRFSTSFPQSFTPDWKLVAGSWKLI
jgi:hypothetical protein